MMKDLRWNCRGLGQPLKINALKDIIKQEKPKIILLQETNLGGIDMDNIITIIRNYQGVSVHSWAASGGMATMWNQILWRLIAGHKMKYWIKLKM